MPQCCTIAKYLYVASSFQWQPLQLQQSECVTRELTASTINNKNESSTQKDDVNTVTTLPSDNNMNSTKIHRGVRPIVKSPPSDEKDSIKTQGRRTTRQLPAVRLQEQHETLRKKCSTPMSQLPIISLISTMLTPWVPLMCVVHVTNFLYKHSVRKAVLFVCWMHLQSQQYCSTNSPDGVEYCHTCVMYLTKKKISPGSIANSLLFPTSPTDLPSLNVAEW